MAHIHGQAGEWARVRGTIFGLLPVFLGVFAAGASISVFIFSVAWGAALLAAVGIYLIWSLMAGFRRIENFFKGARGEEKVSEILKDLPNSYHVFNDYAVGRTRVDHVVAGPGGVFSIETKCWRGVVTIEEGHILLDGQLPDRSPLAQTLHEASLVRKSLAAKGWSGVVTPVLAFASDSFSAHRAKLDGTIIINSNELRKSFDTDRVVIPSAELDRLVSLMENNV